MEWRDEGAVLSVRRYGEGSAIVEAFTAAHGRHAGVVRGGGSRRMLPLLQPGAQLDLTWRARLEDHIGSFTAEPLRARGGIMGDRLGLAALSAVCALLHVTLPEREPHPALYRATVGLLDGVAEGEAAALAYLRWELVLLEELGYGLDLGSCAVSGAREDLAYVSPKSGRAVARAAAGIWAERLLPLPECLLGQGPGTVAEVLAGLKTTGYFIEGRLLADLGGKPVPEARRRLVAAVARGLRDGRA